MRKLLTNYKYMLHFIIFFKKSIYSFSERTRWQLPSLCGFPAIIHWTVIPSSLSKREMITSASSTCFYYCIHVLGFMACASVYMCISSSEAITILCRSFYAEVRVFSLLLRASIMLESEEQLWFVQLFALYFCLILSLLLSGTGSSTGNHFSWAEFQNGLYFGCPITASKHNAKLLFKTMHRQELPPV